MDSANSGVHICHLFVSPLKNESRLFKELDTATRLLPKEQLLTIGLQKTAGDSTGLLEGKFPYELVQLKSDRLPKTLPFQLVKYLEWTVKAGIKAARSGARIFHCHSLPAAPATALAKILNPRSRFIYDAHELETERANMSGFRQKATAVLERTIMRFVDEILVVSPSIERHYKKAYPGKSVTLLMNMPMAQKVVRTGDVRRRLELNETDKLAIYVGALAPMRGIELLLEAVENVEGWHALFLGSGPLEDRIRTAAKNNSRVHHLPPVPQEQILSHIADADLSYCVIDCSAQSYRFALPNKFFQSLSAGVPVLVNELNLDMIQTGQESGGVFSTPYISNPISDFLRDFDSGAGVSSESCFFFWEHQEPALIRIYSSLMLEAGNSLSENP